MLNIVATMPAKERQQHNFHLHLQFLSPLPSNVGQFSREIYYSNVTRSFETRIVMRNSNIALGERGNLASYFYRRGLKIDRELASIARWMTLADHLGLVE